MPNYQPLLKENREYFLEHLRRKPLGGSGGMVPWEILHMSTRNKLTHSMGSNTGMCSAVILSAFDANTLNLLYRLLAL